MSSCFSMSTALLHSTKSSSSSLTVFNFSLTVCTPSNPTMCRAGGLSCPPIAATACTRSRVVLLGVGAHRRRAAYLMRKDIDLHVRLHNAELDVERCDLYMLSPGVPRCAVMAVSRTMCPFFFARKIGNVALIMFTGPKKFVSN
ncbi:hypothetical protein KC367_g142 [Hortaea werneckii]|nr:hypothetical protein KC367_g142 [Hortaea werneckii]